MELIEQMYSTQTDIIHGKSDIKPDNLSLSDIIDNNQGFSQDLLLSLGIQGILQIVKKENSIIHHRIMKIQNKNEEIKNDVDRYLKLVMNLRKKVKPSFHFSFFVLTVCFFFDFFSVFFIPLCLPIFFFASLLLNS
jgi:hypothetical protein